MFTKHVLGNRQFIKTILWVRKQSSHQHNQDSYRFYFDNNHLPTLSFWMLLDKWSNKESWKWPQITRNTIPSRIHENLAYLPRDFRRDQQMWKKSSLCDCGENLYLECCILFRTPYWQREPWTWKGLVIRLWMKKQKKCLRQWKHTESEEGDTCVCADVAEGQKDLSKHKTHSRLREEKHKALKLIRNSHFFLVPGRVFSTFFLKQENELVLNFMPWIFFNPCLMEIKV